MASVRLEISDPANRMTLRAILEAGGHTLSDGSSDVAITDNPEAAVASSDRVPTLVLVALSELGEGVRAMRKGVYGYIVVPFLPGEAEIMVRRAAKSRSPGPLSMPHQQPEPLAEVEARHIRKVLRYCKNNRAKAARILGIGRNTLWRKLKEIEHTGLSD